VRPKVRSIPKKALLFEKRSKNSCGLAVQATLAGKISGLGCQKKNLGAGFVPETHAPLADADGL
jgi:hypothetical protein